MAPVIDVADAELVARSRRRDAAAFGALVARHQDLVHGVALARCGDPALADDVVQDAFITAWRELDRLRDDASVGPWVAGIARNLAANALRARARAMPGGGAPVVEDRAGSPEDAAIEHEDRALLLRALADLPDAFRDVLVRYYLDGMSIAAIAQALGVREDLVKQRLSRGRKALRAAVADRVDSALTRARKNLGAAGVGKALAIMTSKQIAFGVIAALALAGGAAWLVTRGGDAPPAAPAAKPAAPAASASAQPAPAKSGSAAGSAAAPHVQRLPDRDRRAALLDAIRNQRAARTGTSASTSSGAAPALPPHELDKDYIRSSVRELLPMLTECYSAALERDPKLAGDMVVDFTIEGEPGVGGVIGESLINDEKSTIADPGMRECIQETMYGIQIDPPADGGVVHVTYPFAFSP